MKANIDKTLLKKEVEALRIKGHQFEQGEISRNEFKGTSGGLGSYAQKEAGKYMIRLKTPAGVITRDVLNLIIGYCDRYGADTLHLTTRQAIQLHNLTIDETCDIMSDGIDHDLFTRGGGGNFPRNVALSPMAGADPGEAFDAAPYAQQVGQYFQERATTYHLPRKLKVSFSSLIEDDTACAAVNDMGFVPVLENGKPVFKLYLAGGIGNQPGVGYLFAETVMPEQVLYYVEALVRLFVAEGDYENKSRARLRFIPRRMGVDAFMECYRNHLSEVMESEQFEGNSPVLETYQSWTSELEEYPMVIAQKQRDRYTVVIHPLCGQLILADAKVIAKFMSQTPNAQLRSSMSEDLYVRNLTREEALACVETVSSFNQVQQIGRTVTCIGTPSCQQGVIQSQALCMAINQAVREAGLNGDILPPVHISGCPSSCSRHQVSPIGLVGKRAKTSEGAADCFELHLDGSVGAQAGLASVAGVIPAQQVPLFIVEMGKLKEETGENFESLIKMPEFAELLKKYCI